VATEPANQIECSHQRETALKHQKTVDESETDDINNRLDRQQRSNSY